MNPGSSKSPEPEQAASALPEWLTPFRPRRGLTNGHLQTIVGNYLRRPPFRTDGLAETVEVDPADGSRVLCHCHWQPQAVRAQRLSGTLESFAKAQSRSMRGKPVTISNLVPGITLDTTQCDFLSYFVARRHHLV